MRTKISFSVLLFILLMNGAPLMAQDTTRAAPATKRSQETPPPDFVPVDKEPQIIKEAKPSYPEVAQKAGIEGRVIVKIWVNKEGEPRQAVVVKSDAEIFNRPVVEAAMKYRFTPAMLDNKPVGVWVVVPFTFKLKKDSSRVTKSSRPARESIKYSDLSSPPVSNRRGLEQLISLYNAGMKYERLKEYSRARKAYEAFLADSKYAGINLDEMVDHARLVIEKHEKLQKKGK